MKQESIQKKKMELRISHKHKSQFPINTHIYETKYVYFYSGTRSSFFPSILKVR